MDGFGRSNLNAGNLFSSPKGLFDTNHPMELIDEPLAGYCSVKIMMKKNMQFIPAESDIPLYCGKIIFEE